MHQEINQFGKQLDEVKKCHSAENVTKCKMDAMGWSDQEAIIILGLNKSK